MNISEINQFVTLKTGADTTAYSAANRLISTNRWMHKIWTMILDSQGDWDMDDSNQTTYPIATTPLVANQRDYAFTSALKLLTLRRVDISYDDNNFYKAAPIDVNEIPYGIADSGVLYDSNLDTKFSLTSPRYDLRNNVLFIYPAPTVTLGTIRIEYLREPTEYTSAEVTTGTKEPGFDEPFHIMVALGMIYDWCSSKSSPHLMDLKNEVKQELAEYEVRLRKFYSRKDQDSVPTFISNLPSYK